MVFIDDLAAEFHGARVKLIGSENGFEKFRSSRAEHSGNSENLALMKLKGHVLKYSFLVRLLTLSTTSSETIRSSGRL